jgi:uncharacterized protein YoxC
MGSQTIIENTTAISLTIQQFLGVALYIITQTGMIVGVYWKINKKVDDATNTINLVRSETNNQHIEQEKAMIIQEERCFNRNKQVNEKIIDVKCQSEKDNASLHKVLGSLDKTIKNLDKTMQVISKEFGEHKAYHKGKEDAEKLKK